MLELGIIIIVLTFVTILLRRLNKDYVIPIICKRVKTIDGSPLEDSVAVDLGSSIFGSTFVWFKLNLEDLFYFTRQQAQRFKRSYVQYVFGCPLYNVIDAVDAELILTDTRLITKANFYKFLHPFLKTGLLTSTGKKWHTRRRLLTPAFHFNILGQFMDIFKQESSKFVQNLHHLCDVSSDNIVSLSETIPRFTLNNICETALGVRLDEHLDGDEYRENISKVEESFVKRTINPLLMSDIAYKYLGDGRRDEQYLKKLHDFSCGIIEKRRALFEEELKANIENPTDPIDTDFIFKKKRYAMLDTMLRAEKDGLIDHAGICEEVDTFVFEGFDTTSMNLIFCLMNLALYPDMQQRCYKEIEEFMSDDLANLDIAQLSNLKYLECFIKETQRLYPSVPIILRECLEDTNLSNNLILPAGTQIELHIFDVHRNPKYWNDPDEFQPERFLPENSENRHSFAFIPFSAGQRNCIGQKFAMLEVKTLLVYVLKHFELKAVTDPASFRFLAGILIRAQSNVQIKLLKRQAS
ncbi:cytochrome P450 4p1-like [Teleopsis dalmanni]|uniref:cytochrome P450 4p1-like n=1 Tax=Teleopsis dalmanni TaxID=139649 RepID=UPI0018CD3128|nr:cytochrome P450 4p1-like [Teleopsis dalmanni]